MVEGYLINDRWVDIPEDKIIRRLSRLGVAGWGDRVLTVGDEDWHYLASRDYAWPYSLPRDVVWRLAERLNEGVAKMAFDWKMWINRFIDEPGYNDAGDYGVTINKTENLFEAIGIHHLTPDENRGNHNVFLDVLDKTNQRITGARIKWTWEGRTDPNLPDPVLIDKPANEIADLSIFPGMVIKVWLPFGHSVLGLRANHPDELGPNGEKWNTIGHHSFLVVFRETAEPPPPPPDPEPDPDPPPAGAIAITGGLQVTVNQAAIAAMRPDNQGNVTIMLEVRG